MSRSDYMTVWEVRYLCTSTLALLSWVIFLMVAPPRPMIAPTMSLDTRILRGKSTPRPGRRPFSTPRSSLPISPIDEPAIGFSISRNFKIKRILRRSKIIWVLLSSTVWFSISKRYLKKIGFWDFRDYLFILSYILSNQAVMCNIILFI